MGAWSHDALGNDTACDWVAQLVEQTTLDPVQQAIAAVLASTDDAVDASVAEEALAAAEVVSRLRGHAGFRNAYSESLDVWAFKLRLQPSPQLVSETQQALERILGDDSELKLLWDDSDHAADWRESVLALRARVASTPLPVQSVTVNAANQSAASTEADEVGAILEQLSRLEFSVGELTAGMHFTGLYNAVLASNAICDVVTLRAAIARLWKPLSQMGSYDVLWDLAVREAQSWAWQGHLDTALSQLEAWRGAPENAKPGQFEARAAGLCVAGRDIERARVFYRQASASAPNDVAPLLDLALLEARLGSHQVAGELLASARAQTSGSLGFGETLIDGIIAVRAQRSDALMLMTATMRTLLSYAQSGPAAWSIFAFGTGWWALALQQVGRSNEARQALSLIQPILMNMQHLELIEMLLKQGLLEASVAVPHALVASVEGTPVISRADIEVDRGVFRSVRMTGVNALKFAEAKRREFMQGSGIYPFLIGNDEDLSELLDLCTIPPDGGRANLEAARQLDVPAWLAEHAPKPAKAWPKQAGAAPTTLESLFDVLTGELKQSIHVGLIKLDSPHELFARIGFGDWNDCPPPQVHTALHRYWHDQFGSLPMVVSGSVVECAVSQPPQDKAAALKLAGEQHGYCYDIVEQGAGTTNKLAAALLKAGYWYFWWD